MLFFYLNLITFGMSAQHIIPEEIKTEVEAAMAYYPQLKDVEIEFKFKKEIKHSTMQAQPSMGSFFKHSTKRSYKIFISEKFKITTKEFLTKHLPPDVLIGWIGHELGHVLDYQNRSKINLIGFGLNYLFSEKHIINAERAADTYAVKQGMSEYILITKNFILNHADISAEYKNRMKKYYLSPEEIMHLIKEGEKEKNF